MSNPVKDLLKVISEKKKFKIGRIVASNKTTYSVLENNGGQLQAFGKGYTKGQVVLIEGSNIVGTINSKIDRVWVT